MTRLELEIRIQERQARFLLEAENNRRLNLAAQPQSLRVRLADALQSLNQRLNPQPTTGHASPVRPIPCQESQHNTRA